MMKYREKGNPRDEAAPKNGMPVKRITTCPDTSGVQTTDK
jgi:hypothetical protein